MECNIPYKAFYFTQDYLWETNWRNNSFIQYQQEKQEQLEKLLNKTTGKAVHNKNAYYNVWGRRWVDLSLCWDSWGSPLCHDALRLNNELNDLEKSKSKKKVGLRTVRDFIDVYGYNIPDHLGEYVQLVQNDVTRVRFLKERKERLIEQKNKNDIEREKKKLKKEWAFLKNIYNDTSIFGNEKNYKNFVDSNIRSGPIFKCMCDYHTRFN